jgi:hypothetical protein
MKRNMDVSLGGLRKIEAPDETPVFISLPGGKTLRASLLVEGEARPTGKDDKPVRSSRTHGRAVDEGYVVGSLQACAES